MKFNPTLLLIITAASLVLSACNNKPKTESDNTVTPSGKNTYSDSASSSVRVFDQNGKVCIQQTNTYYEMVNVYEGSTKTPLLLKIKKTDLCYADSTNRDKVYEISAKSVMDQKPVNWDAKFVATDLQFKDNTMVATHEGGDNEEDFITRFALGSGKEVFSGSYGELKIAVPNVKSKQFIGYTSQKAVTNPLKALNQENLLGVIRYGSSTEPFNAITVKLKRSKVTGKVSTSTPDMVFLSGNSNTTVIEDGKSVILMKADEHFKPADVKDFALKLTFYYGDDNEATEIIIPIINERLDVTQAKYDKDLFELANL